MHAPLLVITRVATKVPAACDGESLLDRRRSRRERKNQKHDAQHQGTRNQPEKPVACGLEEAEKHAGAEEKEDHTHDSRLLYQRDLTGRGKP